MAEVNPTTNDADPQATVSLEQATHDFAAPPKPTTLASAVQVPGYRIEGILGRGGMGVVYKAVQEKANRPVALKMILAGAHADPAEKTRFRAEAEAAGRLSHPNIVQLYDVNETPDGFPFFSLEFVAGGSLADRLKQGPMKPDEAAALVEALARAMQYAHEHSIIHRDLKPANILLTAASSQQTAVSRTVVMGSTLTPDGWRLAAVPKISDFGLAKQLDTDDGITRTGAIMGTPSYMAPEQAFGRSKDVGPAADIYALGAILYECLTGRPPFKGASVADTLEQVRTMEPITLRTYAKETPGDLETICLHCLHKEPQRRYASAEALADDLRRFLEHKPITVRPAGSVERVWRWCRRNPGWAAVFAAIALLLCSVTGISLYAYVTVAEQNRIIQAKSDAIEKESKEKEKQRVIADVKRKEAEAARLKSEERHDQAVAAIKLFATDARRFCEDAMMPKESKKRLFDVLVVQLEKAAEEDAGKEFSDEGARNTIFLQQTIASVQMELSDYAAAQVALQKAKKVSDRWLAEKPADPVARSYRAAILHMSGARHENLRDPVQARNEYSAAYEIRKKIADDPEATRPVERHTPGKVLTDVADSLDGLQRWDESIAVRLKAQAHLDDLFEQGKVNADAAYFTLEALNRTYWRAAQDDKHDYAKKKEYLDKANATSEKLVKLRPTGRQARERWAKLLQTYAAEELKQAELAAQAKKDAQAKEHHVAAQRLFARHAVVVSKLATSDEHLEQRRAFAQAWYDLARIEKQLGRVEEARAHFAYCLALREEVLRDYSSASKIMDMKLDRLMPLVMLGRHMEALPEAEVMSVKGGGNRTYYGLALVFAQCISAVEEARRPAPLTQADKELQDSCRDKALKCLESAANSGFSEWVKMKSDPALAPLRHEPRFQRLWTKEKD